MIAGTADPGLNATPAGSRLATLDVLRAGAVFLVFGAHLQPPPADAPTWLAGVVRLWSRSGWAGVDLFFVLSGFLVSGLLFREHRRYGAIRVGHFLLRRGFKIYPAFYLLLAVSLLVPDRLPRPPVLHRMLAEVFFLQSYLAHVWTHTWSLAVEEHFYLFLPGLLWLLLRVRRPGAEPFQGLVPVCIGIQFAVLTLRSAHAFLAPLGTGGLREATHFRVDALLFGVILSYLWHTRGDALHSWLARRRGRLAGLSAILILPVFVLDAPASRWLNGPGLTALYLGFGGLLLLCLGLKPTNRSSSWGRLTRLFAWLGQHSYSIYLWHMPMLLWGIAIARAIAGGELGYRTEIVLYVFGSVASGIALAKLVELPMLRLRDRLVPSRSPGIGSA